MPPIYLGMIIPNELEAHLLYDVENDLKEMSNVILKMFIRDIIEEIKRINSDV